MRFYNIIPNNLADLHAQSSHHFPTNEVKDIKKKLICKYLFAIFIQIFSKFDEISLCGLFSLRAAGGDPEGAS